MAELLKLEQAADQVELVSKNYKGKVDGVRLGQRIQTGKWFDKDKAKRELKRLTAKAGVNVVVEVEVVEAGSDEVKRGYYRTLWQARGLV